MGPNTRIVIKAFDQINFVLGLDITVLGDPQIDADFRLIDLIPRNPRVFYCLITAVNANTSGPRPATEVFLGLIPQRRFRMYKCPPSVSPT